MNYIITQAQVDEIVNGRTFNQRAEIVGSLKPIEPLTENQLKKLWATMPGHWPFPPHGYVPFARAIEAAITGEKK